jgi:hypothetical protein
VIDGENSCSLSGADNTSTSLRAVSNPNCQSVTADVLCPNGAVRDTDLVAQRLSATVVGSALSGTVTKTYDVFSAGTSTRVGTLTYVETFNAAR